MQRAIELIISLVAFLISASFAEAITIKTAELQNGVAVIEGIKAEGLAGITWDGTTVTQASNGGTFKFAGAVPLDCVGTLSDGVDTVAVALVNCTPTLAVLTTGQTTCWDSSGTQITCAGTGQDGELQKGAIRSYTDNADGTITDNVTGLVWEKLTNTATIHNVNSTYTWDQAFQKIADLNTATFAGHNDWRLPNINELQTLLDYGRVFPAINPVFNNNIDSFTQRDNYWTSTTFQPAGAASLAWFIRFEEGVISRTNKDVSAFAVRAVRGAP
jgi:hypothetical protein